MSISLRYYIQRLTIEHIGLFDILRREYGMLAPFDLILDIRCSICYTVCMVRLIDISDIVENNEQTIADAIINVLDGLVSKTTAPISIKVINGDFILWDGYHRVAQAIINKESKISAIFVIDGYFS